MRHFGFAADKTESCFKVASAAAWASLAVERAYEMKTSAMRTPDPTPVAAETLAT
jgi:hypothetical protein